MKLILNGENFETQAATLGRLLDELKIEPGRVAIEVNLTVKKRAEYAQCILKDGDVIEIVNFVGGGSEK